MVQEELSRHEADSFPGKEKSTGMSREKKEIGLEKNWEGPGDLRAW